MLVDFYQTIFIGSIDVPSDIIEQGEAAIHAYASSHDGSLDKGIVTDQSFVIPSTDAISKQF